MDFIFALQAFFWAVKHYEATEVSPKGVSVGAFAFDNCHRPEQVCYDAMLLIIIFIHGGLASWQ